MRTSKTVIYDLPNDVKINEVIEKAKQTAINDAASLEMTSSNSEIDSTNIFSGNETTDIYNESSDEGEVEDDQWIHRDFDNVSELNEETHSPYVVILDESGVERLVRKTTYLWMLTEEYDKLSNDRTKRFKKNDESKRKKRKLD